MLESQFQDRSVCEYTVLSTHNGVDQLEKTRSIDDLLTSQSIEGRRDSPDFEMLVARIASALRKIIFNNPLSKGE